MTDWLDANFVSLLNGVATGCVYYMVAVGLSLIFGMLNVLNLAHGTLYLLGAYTAVEVMGGDGGWAALAGALLMAVAVGTIAGCGLALMVQPLARRGQMAQALLTLGIALVAGQAMELAFGANVVSVDPPDGLAGTVDLAGHAYPVYRLVLIGWGAILAIVVTVIMARTSLGALVRATVVDRDMVRAIGVDVRKVVFGVFALGASLATVGGVLGAPLIGAAPGIDNEVLLVCLVVVVIGGLGSVPGALVGALLIGQVQTLGTAIAPEYASFLMFVVLALVLGLRPAGLLGRAQGHPA